MMYLVLIVTFCLVYWLYAWHSVNRLPSPWLYLPFLGHVEVFQKASNTSERLARLYKKYARNGIMHVRVFGISNIFVGDLQTLKYLFNHPHMQNRGQ